MTDSFNENCDQSCEDGLMFGLIILSLPTLVAIYACSCSLYNDFRKYMIKKRIKRRVVVFEDKLTPMYIKELNKNFKDDIINNDCSICLAELNIYKHKTVCLPCHHAFHEKCLQEWIIPNISQGIEPGCPICRKIIVKKRVTNLNYDDYAELEV